MLCGNCGKTCPPEHKALQLLSEGAVSVICKDCVLNVKTLRVVLVRDKVDTPWQVDLVMPVEMLKD